MLSRVLRRLKAEALDAPQARLIFGTPRPVRTIVPGPNADGYQTQRLHLPSGSVALSGWAAVPAAGRPPARATLVYFAGRNEHPGWVPHIASYLPAWNVVTYAYRGRLGSAGRAGEREAIEDARRIHGWARDTFDLPVAVMGRSLGTAVALRLADENAPIALVLASPFTCLADVLGRPWPTLERLGALRHPLRAIDVAPGIHAPTLVLLAAVDRRVPHAVSQRLIQALPQVDRAVTVAGTTHQSLPRAPAALAEVGAFLQGHEPASVN